MKAKPKKPKKPNAPLKNVMREKFAQKLAAGMSQSDALRAVKPRANGWKDSVVRVEASKLAAREDVRARKAEILSEAIPETVLKRVQLLELMSDEIRNAARSPGALAASASLIDKFAKMMDWYPKAEVTVRNGGVSDDYQAPPGVRDLTDEQIRALLAR